MQMHYNLVERSIEREFLDLAAAEDMAITPWSPLAGGLLTGKYDAGPGGAAAEGRLSRSPMGARTLRERNIEVSRALSKLAREVNRSPAQLALAWLMQRTPVTTIPIIGARTLAQLEDNLGATEVRLGESQLAALGALAPLEPEYPASLLASEFYARMMFGETAGQVIGHSPNR
jgi:aryl-alcohol dehydrogenase-like predicted oxidoreductase